MSGEEIFLNPGDVFYLPLGLRYRSYWCIDSDGRVEWDSYAFTEIPAANDPKYTMQILKPDGEAVRYLDQLSLDQTVSPTSIGLLYLFLGRVMTKMTEDHLDPKESLLAKAKRFIVSHPQFTVPELARHCGVSESGIYSLFHSYAGMTPIEMKNQIKVEKAIQLLSSTDMSIEEISTQLQFSSSAYFRKIVKAQTGKTPTKIRKEHYLTDSF
ncbi:MAG: helix-turn-helix transcriptional regulator [Clostridia bacterium]|nr:helix-turn-helix transcriptional regulator [Clostridia bacterium]